MEVEWKNVFLSAPNKGKKFRGKFAHLLKNACGKASPGRITAIMGPSGCGKTSLIKALAGRVPPGSETKGEILCNGKQRDVKQWIRKTGFVDQDDNVFDNLTAFDTLMYAAKFRSDMKDNDEIKSVVDKIFSELGIAHVALNKMDSVSGGERKRVLIGVELVSNPSIIFLDEPTSGLDSTAALMLIKLLKKIAVQRKITVIFSIHQPNSQIFSNFDDLVLLSEGVTIYKGEKDSCAKFFGDLGLSPQEGITFQDFLIDILGGAKHYDEVIQQSREYENYLSKLDNENKNAGMGGYKRSNMYYVDYYPNLSHIWLLLVRRYKLYMKTKRIIISLVIQALLMIIFCWGTLKIIGIMEMGDIKKVFNEHELRSDVFLAKIVGALGKNIFIFVLNLAVFFIFSLIAPALGSTCSTAFYSENTIIRREMAVGTYSTLSYYLSVLIFEGLIGSVVPFIVAIALKAIYYDWVMFSMAAGIAFYEIYLIGFFLLVGSLSTGKKTVLALTCLFLVFTFIPSLVIAIVFFIMAIIDDKTTFGTTSFIYTLTLPSFYNAFIYALIFKFIESYIDPLNLFRNMFPNMNPQSDEYFGYTKAFYMMAQKNVKFSDIPSFFLGTKVPFIFITIMVALIPFICIALGTLSIGRLTRPHFRMKLNK